MADDIGQPDPNAGMLQPVSGPGVPDRDGPLGDIGPVGFEAGAWAGTSDPVVSRLVNSDASLNK